MALLQSQLKTAEGCDVLEIGCYAWRWWLHRGGIRPRRLTCINISEAEIEIGRRKAQRSAIQPEFCQMDAHSMTFGDAQFDLVFGDAILHHLELETALGEIARVLKPDGRIVFSEPLDINPVGKLIRRLTPSARTKDEQAFRFRELRMLRKRFQTSITTFELFAVPVGIASRFIFSEPCNVLTWAADGVDRCVQSAVPPLKWMYRNMVIVGTPLVCGPIHD